MNSVNFSLYFKNKGSKKPPFQLQVIFLFVLWDFLTMLLLENQSGDSPG